MEAIITPEYLAAEAEGMAEMSRVWKADGKSRHRPYKRDDVLKASGGCYSRKSLIWKERNGKQ